MTRSLRPGAGDEMRHIIADGQFDPERSVGIRRGIVGLQGLPQAPRLNPYDGIGLYFGWLLGGTVLVETVFDWPGIGLYATKSILTQDFMPVMGVVLSIGTLFVVFNLVIDLLYGVINPKVQLR